MGLQDWDGGVPLIGTEPHYCSQQRGRLALHGSCWGCASQSRTAAGRGCAGRQEGHSSVCTLLLQLLHKASSKEQRVQGFELYFVPGDANGSFLSFSG